MLDEIERVNKTRRVVINRGFNGPVVTLACPTGYQLGTIAEVEAWAKRRRLKRRKK